MGTFWPIPAVLLAKNAHAPDITIMVEGGVITQEVPQRVPLIASDACLGSAMNFVGDTLDTLGDALHGGWIDVAVLSTNNIDRYGNLNTTCIGPYKTPKARLAGSGGACDLGSLSKRVIIMLLQKKGRFQEKVDYITTPGYLMGGNSRIKAGLLGNTGPSKVITDLGIYGFDHDTKEMILESTQPGITLDRIEQNVQWPLKYSSEIKEAVPPTDEELRILREVVDLYGMYLNDKRYNL
jgi:glutaconate CoA-transferase subunit B